MPVTYKIGEAAALLNLKTYVLRFWETEFTQISPLRTEKGQRLYTEDHLALLDRIRFLLHERGLTIEGTRKVLAEEASLGVRYVRAHGLLQDEPAAAPTEYDSSPEKMPEDDNTDPDGEYSEILSYANAPALPAYGMAPSSQTPGADKGASASARGVEQPVPRPEVQSSGLTSGADQRKDIPIGLGVGFETVHGKAGPAGIDGDPSSKPHTMEQGMLMHTRTAGPGQENPNEEAGIVETQGPSGKAGTASPAPLRNDWDAIKNAFDSSLEDEGWDLIQNNERSGGHGSAGKNARSTMKEITDELEAVAELLRGRTAGTPS